MDESRVLARKYRPKSFDAVVGQHAVTRTLRNAISSGRIHQAYVFAGPRGVGKTTTARLLARALNCVNGPTPDPCGICDACQEIAQSRDMDVLEIDAATHTGIDNVREVIISGLAIMPVRDRYKVFIIDEAHQLSVPSFNALLKSIEEPPPHVVFIMATTAGEKIPNTILSRAQVFEFRPIGLASIAAQLRMIGDAERLTVPDDALALIARAADGSMRDAESALDQVIAFAGTAITTDDVSTVLGIVGRDLVFEMAGAVADENPAAAFSLAGRAVEFGYDLRLVCRELARLARDLLLVRVDPSLAADPDLATESERERLGTLAARFSREDLLRAFDLLTGAEKDIKESAQPRYFLEMLLLRWIHLRKLLPIEDVIAGLDRGVGGGPAQARPGGSSSGGGLRPSLAPTRPTFSRPDPLRKPGGPQALAPRLQDMRAGGAVAARAAEPVTVVVEPETVPADAAVPLAPDVRDRFLAELKRSKAAFFGMVIAQAQTVECDGRQLVVTFSPEREHLRAQVDARRAELEAVAAQVVGRRVPVVTARGIMPSPSEPMPPIAAPVAPPPADGGLKARALGDATVQALLEIIPAEISEVEEI
jgi:DNA polymerase III subunit gamma/tau